MSVAAGALYYTAYTYRGNFAPWQKWAEVIDRTASNPTIVSLNDFDATPVGAYLDRPVFSAAAGRKIRFVRNDLAAVRARGQSPGRLARRAARFIARTPGDVVVISRGEALDRALAREAPGGQRIIGNVFFYPAAARAQVRCRHCPYVV